MWGMLDMCVCTTSLHGGIRMRVSSTGCLYAGCFVWGSASGVASKDIRLLGVGGEEGLLHVII